MWPSWVLPAQKIDADEPDWVPGYSVEGTYWLNSQLVSELDDDELARIRNKEIGFVFRHSTFWPAPRRCTMWNAADLRRHSDGRAPWSDAKGALAAVGMESRMSHKPNELSGGQRQLWRLREHW